MFPFSKVIITCWIVFWIYWFISAFGSKKGSPTYLRRFMGIRIFIFVLAVVLFRFLNVQNYSFQNRLTTSNELVRIIGTIIFLLGLLLAVWARIYLGKNWGFPMSQKNDPELVTDGPYRYIRHPIYTGILMGILGSAIANSVFWFTLLIIAGIYFIYSAVMEENLMIKQFPKVYPSYKSKTKMLIPFIF
jgi:protein-S-isoprenylcysteine O-methyltransferase Ste14